MWLKYQQVTTKMSSFDPREIVRTREHETIKYPLKRFEPTLRTSMKVVLPMNLERLRKHKSNIEKYAYTKNWKNLNIEQINASRTVQQLKATLNELEKIKHQICEGDFKAYEKQMEPIKKDASTAIHEFSEMQQLIAVEVQKSINEQQQQQQQQEKEDVSHPLLPEVENDTSTLNSSGDVSEMFTAGPISRQIQINENDYDNLKEEIVACQSWDGLRDGLIELNSLVKDFASIVHHQQEAVDNIENNIEEAHENVSNATGFLAQASKYKAAAIPVAGAVVGGLIAGPVGLLAGFKLAGAAAAVGGGIAGYQGGKYLKKKHDDKVDVELENLSKNQDIETPD